MPTLRTFFAQVHGQQDTLRFHNGVCRFASEHLLVQPLTTVASRLDPIRIVRLPSSPHLCLRAVRSLEAQAHGTAGLA